MRGLRGPSSPISKKENIMTLTAKEFSVLPEIFKSARTTAIQHQGPFTLHFNLPGHNVPGAIDHGYGPLALIVEALLDPGPWLRFPPHTNDEIIIGARALSQRITRTACCARLPNKQEAFVPCVCA